MKRELLLGRLELLLEGLWHLWGRGTGEPELDLDTVVDEPLERGEGTDHDDPGTETGPQTCEAEVAGRRAEGGALGLVHVGHDGVGGVGDHGAEHTGDVTGGEGDDQLLALGALGTGLGHHVGVQELDGLLEAGKLHHGVGDLSAPQGNERLIEAVDALGSVDLGEGAPEGGGEGADLGGLHSHLTSLHWRQRNVGEELRAGGGGQVEPGPVEEGVLLAHGVTVDALEDLVEAELAETLHGVADGGRSPPEEEGLRATLRHSHLEAVAKVLVLLFVNLKTQNN